MFGLPVDPFAPLMAIGSRMTGQKLADVVLDALPRLLERHPRLQLAVIGKGEAYIEKGFRKLAQQWPDRVGVHIGYDERRAHALHAGADILLHASRFEPCGLTQLYAMRYGTLPVASRVGGLADTIVDAAQNIDRMIGAMSRNALRPATYLRDGTTGQPVAVTPVHAAFREPTGFLFDGERPQDVIAAADRALDAYMRPQVWRALQRNAMSCDFGWNEAVGKMVALYVDVSGVRPNRAALRPRRAPAAASQKHDDHAIANGKTRVAKLA
jgi:starch synthase